MTQDIPDSKYIESSPEYETYETDEDYIDPDAQIDEAAETLKKALMKVLDEHGTKYLDDDTNLRDAIYVFKYNDIGHVIAYPSDWCHQLLGQLITIFPDEYIQWLEDNYGRVHDKLTEGFLELV